MNQNSFFTFLTCLHFCIFSFFLSPQKCFCVDPNYYEACFPRNCGSHNISYPFYIRDLQNRSCGHPGFELNCSNNGVPTLHILENDYVIDHIFYQNRSLRVHNAAVLSTETVCLPRIRNRTLDDERFVYNSDVSELVLFSNCSTELPGGHLRYEVGCGDGNGGGWGLAMLSDDGGVSYGREHCRENVVAPVDLYGGGGGGCNGVWELLSRGFVLNWRASDCSVCEESGGRCGFDFDTYHFKCFCPDRPHAARCRRSKTHSRLLMKASIATVAAGFGILMIVIICLRRKLGKYMVFWGKKTEMYQNVETFLKNYGSLAPKRYCYSDVKKMTNSFKDKLGQGGYGCVYKGKLCSGNLVAVKVLSESKGNGDEFINEVASISRTSHINIVTLLGFCFEGRKRALIYKFMPNGSLEKFVYDGISSTNRQLGWEKSYHIAIGIARGLEYLHRGCKKQILHFDIKPHNILLDEDFCPKISDFGLAKLYPRKESIISTLTARGTIGYIAPEVFCRNFGRVSHKSDVYSYGMMVLEMVGGRKNVEVEVDSKSKIYFPDLIYKQLESEELGLYGIMNEEENEMARKMIIVSLWCIQMDPSTRPSMTRVVEMLEGSFESLKVPPKPLLSSPPRPL